MTSISDIVAPLTLQTDEETEWPPIRLRVRCYLTSTLPPLDLVTSVRAIVLKDDQILVVRDPVSVHLLPGGRREADETLLQTLAREVQEETGWTIQDARLIGLVHFQHITPKPEGYRYLYPDFLQLVYAAAADHYDAALRETDGYELESGFQPIGSVADLPISQGERVFLQAALSQARERAIQTKQELIRRAYEAFNRRDIDAALAVMHPNVEWPNGMEGGYVYGHTDVRDYWTRQWAQIDPHVEPLHLSTDDAGRVVVDVHQVVRDRVGSVLADRIVRHVYTVEDGLVRGMEIRD